jgi:hypothetical protein
MRKTLFVILVVLAILAAVACQNSPTGPNSNLRVSARTVSTESVASTRINVTDLIGTWQATKAVGESALKPGSQRDLVAEGGTVTLVFEGGGQIDDPSNWPRYSISVTMPGKEPTVDTGRWIYNELSISIGYEYPQIDFYPASLPPDFEYGDVPAFLVSLSGNALKLWDSGLTFLPFDFGWNDPPNTNSTVLTLEFTRK